VFDKYVTGIH